MIEQDLIELGFVRKDDEDSDVKYHYYVLEIGDDYQPFCLISNASDEAKEDNWIVFIFDYESIEFDDVDQLRDLISLLKNNVK